MKLVERFMPGCVIGDIEIDEDIDNYWKSLDSQDSNGQLKKRRIAEVTWEA